MTVRYPDEKVATMVFKAVSIDKEIRPDRIQRFISVNGTQINAYEALYLMRA